MKNTDSFHVGIFWAVKNEKNGGSELIGRLALSSDTNKGGTIISPYSHYDIWDNLLNIDKKYDDDCYRSPCATIFYNIKRNQHIIYIDKCFARDMIKEIIKLLKIQDYELRFDVHCSRCERNTGYIK